MFGLEGQKKKKGSEEFVFDLEEELKDPKRDRQLKEEIEKRIHQLKTILRSGEEKEDYDRFGLLLLGYTALLTVVTRVNFKRK